MADYTHSRFDARQRRQIADGIKRHLHKVGLSRKRLARHDLKLSTINKALAGQFSDGTLAKLEAILGRRFEPEELKGAVPNEAPVALSGYSLSTTASFQGRFAVRPRTRSVRQPACALESMGESSSGFAGAAYCSQVRNARAAVTLPSFNHQGWRQL